MRVALISYHTSPLAQLGSSSAGGMNVYVRRLAEGLAGAGVEVDIFTRRDSADSEPELEFAPGARLMTVRAGPARVLPKTDLAHYSSCFAQSLLLLISRQQRHYDVIHSHYWLSGLAAQTIRTDNQPIVHMFHTLGRVKQLYQPGAGDADSPSRNYSELRLLRSGHTMVFSTDAEVDDVERAYGFRPQSIVLIPPGVDSDRFTPADRSEARNALRLGTEAIILCVGRMDKSKGVEFLLEASARLKAARPTLPFRVLIVGGDDSAHPDSTARKELARLQQIAKGLGIADTVEFRGVVPQEELPLYYSAADVCAVPSKYESFGMVALEALSSGCPVVGFKSRGLEHTVRDGRTGLLVESGDIQAMSQALATILTDGCLARRMGIAARASVVEFSWQAVVDRSVDLYSRLLSSTALTTSRSS
jgi:D-inositol-3-phosphate glycosyltransferase